MFDRLRYGTGRWIFLAALIGLLGIGGFFAYSKVMDAAASTTPVPSASSTPSEAVETNPSEEGTANPSADPSADPGETDGGNVNADQTLPFVAFPLPEGAEQSRTVRGDAADDEVFVYIIVSDPKATVADVSKFYLTSLAKDPWTVTPGIDAPELMKVSNGKYSGMITLRAIEGEGKIIVSGILKPLF